MSVDTLTYDVLRPTHETFTEIALCWDEIWKRPFSPLKPLNLWIYGDPGALYPFKPWTLEPGKTFIPWTLSLWILGTPDFLEPQLTWGSLEPWNP